MLKRKKKVRGCVGSESEKIGRNCTIIVVSKLIRVLFERAPALKNKSEALDLSRFIVKRLYRRFRLPPIYLVELQLESRLICSYKNISRGHNEK